MFDLATPIWVKGTLVRLDRISPHAILTLEERIENGKGRRWTAEGPTIQVLNRMGITPGALKVGDVIELCAFPLKAEYSARPPSPNADRSSQFVHGHVLVMPDGHMRLWGTYGKTENCIRPNDQRQSWLNFLNTDPRARDARCNKQLTLIPSRAFSNAFVDEINRHMANPCT